MCYRLKIKIHEMKKNIYMAKSAFINEKFILNK